MKGATRVAAVGVVLGLGLLVELVAAACPADSVQSGTVCMDKYEASVWRVPPTEVSLITKIRNGTASLANLTSAGANAAGVVQLGLAAGDLAANGCPATGNGCLDVFAVSIPGVTPAGFINWFQAGATARNSLKRVPTNQEWQVAALGTPDGADDESTTCNTDPDLGPAVIATGSRGNCTSDVLAFDMVGNVWEWVADWVPRSTACPGWGTFAEDVMCLAGASETSGPGALRRGGIGSDVTVAGVFSVVASDFPTHSSSIIGFRCAR